MSWTLTTSGSAIARAGAGANTTITASGSTLAKWSDEVEGDICLQCRRNWVTQYSSLATTIQGALSSVASGMIAKRIVNYDKNGYGSDLEHETILDMLDDEIQKDMVILKDFKSNDFRDV